MRFQITKEFSECRSAYEKALSHYRDYSDEGPGAFEREWAADSALTAAEILYFNCDAHTPHEVHLKLVDALERGRAVCGVEDFYRIPTINADFARIRRMAPSQEIVNAFEAFRSFEIEWNDDVAALDETNLAKARADDRMRLHSILLGTPCTTAGDFILKQWLRLRFERGHLDTPSLREDGTANLWDIRICEEDEDLADLNGWRSTYRDIASTDLGAHLLAYGRTDFDASEWMDAAARIGLPVNLTLIGEQGKGQIGFGMDLVGRDECARLTRERDRLFQIMAHDHDGHRLKSLFSEIEENWPHLICKQPATEGMPA